MASNAKQLKNRIRSVSSTMHITKAMELVASSKLRRATTQMESARPYFSSMLSVMSKLAKADSVYSTAREVKKSCYIVIAGDRGLAGGYNSNIYKLLKSQTDGKDAVVIPIGKRAADHVSRRGYESVKQYTSVENMTLSQCAEIGVTIKNMYAGGEIDEVYIIYTKYNSILSYEPMVKKILPIETNGEETSGGYVLFEPSTEAVLETVIPEYISGIVCGAVRESFASELSARRTAMDNASKNASEMIEDLELKYNRARQGAITQEITEIIGGSNIS